MSEFKPIETQDELDKIIKNRLDREKAKYADYDTLTEKIQFLETENLNLKSAIESQKENDSNNLTKIADLEKKVSEWELNSLKQQVALKNGLPFELSERLSGSDEESLTADAERLASFINVNNNIPLKDTEPVVDSGNKLNAAFRQAVRDLN